MSSGTSQSTSYSTEMLGPALDNGAYEIPTYDEAFPELVGSTEGTVTPVPSMWGSTKQPVSRISTVTQVFSVPLEERRYREISEFGEKAGQQAKIGQDVMAKTGTHIEMSLARDQSLNVVITGKADRVMQAKKLVLQALQTQGTLSLPIPREHHKYILGQKGKKLQDLELLTATKIQIPRTNENSDCITITGPKDGIEKARHEIQIISDEQAKLAMERIRVEKEYHPFVCGPNNREVIKLMADNGVKINVPPLSVMKDEITVSGEKEGVRIAAQRIRQIYEEKRARCQTISVEVRKSQHKYVIGPRGNNLSEILEKTGISVEVPHTDANSETITLRGDQESLGPALTMVYSKANSVQVLEVPVQSWLHRFIIGRKGANVRKIMDEYPRVHIEFKEGEDKIVVEGPPEEANQAKQQLAAMAEELTARMAYVEIEVDQKFHRHIIGKNGANVNRLKDETGVMIKIPTDEQASNVIRIEGRPESVAQAKHELLEMVNKIENEKTRDIIIEQRFHRTIIGQQGSKIREIRELFNDEVQVNFPDPNKKSDVVSLRGPKNEVDKCFKYLTEMLKELSVNNYQAQVHIFKQFHKNVIGKNGATIRKIRDDTNTKIDLPSENSTSDAIVITGKKENVEKAKLQIEAIQKELANIREETVQIPHKLHNALIGAKGRLIRSIMEENGNVVIRFPDAASSSDRVIIRGPKQDVETAKKQLQELANEKLEASHSAEIVAKPEYHRFLIGRGGVNIRKLRESTGVRVIFPGANEQDKTVISIIGKKEDVERAKIELEKLIENLEQTTEEELEVEPKYHRHFVARRGEVLRQIGDDYGGVIVSFPRNGTNSSKVVLKGANDCVQGAKKRIMEIVDDLKSQITMECMIPQKYHRTVMGNRGMHVQEITREHDVSIKFPDKPTPDGEVANGRAEPLVNGTDDHNEDDNTPSKSDIILIIGRKERCEAAHAALIRFVPISRTMEIPYDLHRYIIGQKGRDVRQMMEEFDVNISIPAADQHNNTVTINGPVDHVEKALEGLANRVKELELEQKDRELKAFTVEVTVDTKYHPKIIGRRGAVISKIRDEYDVNVQFPDKGQDTIKISGYEDKANQAKEAILKIVTDLEQQISKEVEVDRRVHPRLIGQRGRQIRNIMADYKVDIRFCNESDPNPDMIVISGDEENVLDCEEHILNLAEEFIQDVRDRELMDQFRKPSRSDQDSPKSNKQKPFMVRDAPWDRSETNGQGAHPNITPNLESERDFPGLGGGNSGSSAGKNWGPWSKR